MFLWFHFTTERFAHNFPLPFWHGFKDTRTLSCVKEDKLLVLHQPFHSSEIKIWVTNKIESNAVSWSKILKVDMEPVTGFGFKFDDEDDDIFFIDEENKVVVAFSLEEYESYVMSYITGYNGYRKIVDLPKVVNPQNVRIFFLHLCTLALMFQV